MNWQRQVKCSMSTNLQLNLRKKIIFFQDSALTLSYFANMDVTPQATEGAEV